MKPWQGRTRNTEICWGWTMAKHIGVSVWERFLTATAVGPANGSIVCPPKRSAKPGKGWAAKRSCPPYDYDFMDY
ncbi:hypothetical protein MYXO_01759 [Myxococcaceae bacterium]|nr:hypothetical protein MYXO_01759 [Myxococcaceae bacterium]